MSKNNLISRKNAQINNLTHYFTGKECKRGHISKRNVKNRSCMECVKLKKPQYDKNHYKRNSKKIKENVKKWCGENKEHCKQYRQQYYLDNIDYLREKSRKYSLERDYKEYLKKYRQDNKEALRPKDLAHTRKRQAAKLNATPLWYEHEEIKLLYEESARITKESGIVMNVDHVVPLQGKLVSGLHCIANLQIITAEENMKKGNKFEEEIVIIRHTLSAAD